ncbi:DNA polymerase V catalytic protein [Vibrio crassostreae]|nr:DNA polymerase V catalytic protein [Vibrio crassostreae]CAK1713232.1 DNA polymerase V catalytic protein [Vibrio crassostreae]CAK2534032.1 DNA polymerase V catalytic protein [Vibrio crassostreae]CAK2540893.1 DNA polymerase V catalytic protein [Vibrio crassostreae]CAK2595563.1 DNA polymerase V catalytic protein [Vibrio crassostreae]
MFALIDCNAMYVACEQVFRPDLRHLPCIVLSNNDGAVVAANRLAKEAGVKKFEPYFKQKTLIEKRGVNVFSSNYALYADLSAKMMATITAFSPRSHIYSIDECFLDISRFSHIESDLTSFGQRIRQTVWKECRLPVCFGAGDTLTLSKMANRVAKVDKELNGVCIIDSECKRQQYLASQPVSEVWGVGRRLTQRMKLMGIETALDLANLSPEQARCSFNVEIERTVRELNGHPCKTWDECRADKQQIFSTRSVSNRITSLEELKQALAFHAATVARKARYQKSSCTILMAFANTSPFDDLPQNFKDTCTFEFPTNDTGKLTKAVTLMATRLFKPGISYYKIGVGAMNLVSDRQRQQDLFSKPDNPALMQAIDRLNNKLGRDSIFLAAQGTTHDWAMKRNFLSPQYTTKLKDLPRVLC